MLEAEITSDGDVLVEGQHIGQLRGFRFTADPKAEGEAAKTLNVAGQKALAAEIGARATRVSDAVDTAFALSNDSAIRWLGEPVAKIVAGEKILTPRAVLIADEHLSGEALEKVQRRIDLWLAQHVTKLLGGLTLLEQGEGLEGLARGIAFRIAEELGVIERAQLAGDIKSLTQDGRASLRKLGVRFGAYNLYMPALLKPAPRALATQLWALKNGGPEGGSGLEEVAHLASSGRTSFGGNAEIPKDFYRVAGFRVSGERVVRVDILERLADLIRPAVAYRPGVTAGEPPAGTADGNGFVVTVAMTSLAGCSGEAFASILKSMGFTPEQRTGPAITVALVPKASTLPLGAKDEPSDPADAESAEGPSSATESAETTEIAAVEQDSPPRAGEVAKPQGTAAAAVSDEGIPQVPSVPDTPPAQREETSPVAADSENTLAGTAETVVGGEAHSATAAHDMTADAAPQNGGGEDRQHTSQAPAEARSDDQNIIAEGEAGSPAEPVLIEVWNPVRHQRPQRRPHFSRNGISSKPNATGENSGTDAGQPGRPGGGHQEGHRYEGRRQGGNAQRPRHTAGGTAGNETGAEKPRDGAKRFAGKSFSAGRTGSDKSKSDGRSDHGNRSFVSAENRPRDRAPDPLSPFAKLLALKAELEKNKK